MSEASTTGPAVTSTARVLVGRYRIGELIGRGGMAEVHAGTDTRLNRSVAVKLLRPALAADPAFRVRFRQEAQAAAKMSHPTIVRVYDAGEQAVSDPDGNELQLPFIVMERVEGRLLRDLIADGPLAPEEAVRITDGILTALEYSHRAGVVHLDIKPGNVMIAPNGQVKVMDFGIARAISDSSANLAQTSSILGTAQYFSPEQARGEALDARTDLYSTGVVLYELLTGRAPFQADSPVAVAYQHLSETPVSPTLLNSNVSPALSAVVLRALAKDRDERYQDAAEFRDDLATALGGRVPAAPGADSDAFAAALFGVDPNASAASAATLRRLAAGAEEKAPRTQKRPPVALMWAAVALVIVIVGAALYWAFSLTSPDFGIRGAAVEVPDLVGENFAEVSQSIYDLNLRIDDQSRVDSTGTFPEGTIIETIPEAGTRVSPDFQLTVIVSAGPPKVVLPGLTYMDEDEALAQLEELGLVHGTTESTHSPSVRKGLVIGVRLDGDSTVITALTEVDPGSRVDLVTSNGRVMVPGDLVGTPITAARDRLQALQLVVRLHPEANCSGQRVTRQSVQGEQEQRSTVELWYCAA